MGILRFLLAASVLISHSSPILGFTLVDSNIAVKTFYIISGFYMALILSEKYIGSNASYSLFISNRFLRIYPLYWTVMILTIISLMLPPFADYNQSPLLKCLTYFQDMDIKAVLFLILTNLLVFFQDVVMFLGLNTTTGELFFTSDFRETTPQLHTFLLVPQAWTIGIELTFYLIAPFLVKRSLKIILLLIALSLIIRLVLSHFGLKNDPWSYRFFPSEILFFLFGIVAYRIYAIAKTKKIDNFFLQVVFFSVIILTILYSVLPTSYKDIFYLLSMLISLPLIFLLTKNWSYDHYIGELSYPVYIVHILIITCVKPFVTNNDYLGMFVLILSILVSILMNELIAKKIETFRKNRLTFVPAKAESVSSDRRTKNEGT